MTYSEIKIFKKLSTEDINKKLNTLLSELQVLTCVSDEEIEEFKLILELANSPEEEKTS